MATVRCFAGTATRRAKAAVVVAAAAHEAAAVTRLEAVRFPRQGWEWDFCFSARSSRIDTIEAGAAALRDAGILWQVRLCLNLVLPALRDLDEGSCRDAAAFLSAG